MARLTALKKIRSKGLLVAAFTALIGFQAAGVAAQAEPLWTIMIHTEFDDGSEYDFVLNRGISTEHLGDALGLCGLSHGARQPMRYYCYPVPE